MTRREIARELREAANRVLKHDDACCYAIRSRDAHRAFLEMFEQDAQALEGHDKLAWFEAWDEYPDNQLEVQSRRALGLLFCAELVERGDWE